MKEGRRAANEPKLLCSSLYGANSIKSIMGRGGLRKEIEGEKRGKRWRTTWKEAVNFCTLLLLYIKNSYMNNETVFSHSVGRDR